MPHTNCKNKNSLLLQQSGKANKNMYITTLANISQSHQLGCAEDKRYFGCDPMHNAVLAILDGVAACIIRFERQSQKFRCPWVYYETASGKRRATFLSPKEFVGHKWLHNYSEVVNLETGAKYQVSDEQCTCPYWFNAVGTGQERACPHQKLRCELLGQSLTEAIGIIDPDNPPEGCLLQRTDDWIQMEYEVFAWEQKDSQEAPELKNLGRVVQEPQGIWTCGSKSSTGQLFQKIEDSFTFLLNYHGINYSQVLSALESQKAKQVNSYGVCHKCESNYDIPGVDANHCPKCGWVKPPLSRRAQRQRGLVAATAPAAFKNFVLVS